VYSIRFSPSAITCDRTHERRGSHTRRSDSRRRVPSGLVPARVGRGHSVLPLRDQRSRVQGYRPAGRADIPRLRFHHSRRGIRRFVTSRRPTAYRKHVTQQRSVIMSANGRIICATIFTGAVLANRLTEVDDWTVLLIEAGGDETEISDVPLLAAYLQLTQLDWQYKAEPQDTACLGECTSILLYTLDGQTMRTTGIFNVSFPFSIVCTIQITIIQSIAISIVINFTGRSCVIYSIGHLLHLSARLPTLLLFHPLLRSPPSEFSRCLCYSYVIAIDIWIFFKNSFPMP